MNYFRGTPSQLAKGHGLKSLAQVSGMINKRPQTLHNWANDNPELFEIILLGAKAKQDQLLAEKSDAA